MRHPRLLFLLLVAFATPFPAAADFDGCLTLDGTSDLFETRVVTHGDGFMSLVLQELSFRRGGYGGGRLDNGVLALSWTKNTTLAAVHYHCRIQQETATGPCEVHTFFSSGSEVFTETTGRFSTASCSDRQAEPAREGDRIAVGEEEPSF